MADLKKAYCSWCNNLILLKPHNCHISKNENGEMQYIEWSCYYSMWTEYAKELTKEYYKKESAKKKKKRKKQKT